MSFTLIILVVALAGAVLLVGAVAFNVLSKKR